MADRGAVGFQGVQGPATTPTAKPARQPKPTKGPVGFQGPIGINNVVDQSPADGFALPPNIYTHPNGHNVIDPTEIDTGAFATRSAGNLSPTSASSQLAGTGFAPRNTEFANPWNQEGITPPKSKVKIDPRFGVPANEVARMQATQRSLAILEAAPSLKSHPDIVAALAFNADIPFTPQIVKLIATIQKARSAVNYSQDFTPKDYAQMDLLLHPEKFKSHDRLSQMMDSYTTGPEWSQKLMQAVGPMSPYFTAMEGLNLAGKGLHAGSVGLGITVESRTENLPDGITVKAKPNGSLEWFDKDGKPLSSSKAAMIDLDLAGTTGTLAAVAGAPGKVVINPSAVKKAVVQFAADQFDTPQHMYRFIASVQSKYGAGYAALALAPMLLGGAAGTMLGGLGGRAGVEITGAAEEALVNLIAKEGFSDLAATSLTGQALADAEALQAEIIATMTARQAAAKGTADVVEKIATPVGKVAMSGVRGLNKVITSPTLAGADVGFTVGGQGLFRQEYMDSRDGTVWAKKNPKLASTIGRWATQNFDDGWLKTGLSGALDALAAVAVPDAIGAIGRMKGIARSAEGFQGGLLSGRYTKEEIAARQQAKIDKYEQQLNAAVANGTFEQFLAKQLGFKGKLKNTAAWFGKVYDARALNVNNAYVKAGGKYRTGTALSNIDRAYNESPSVRSTVNLIAQTGFASAIMEIDPRFAAYSDLLAEARVLNADGTVNMTESVENVKRVFRDSQTAEALLDPTRNMPLSFMPYSGSNVKRKIGATIKVIDKNGLTKELPLYTNLKELKMENRKFSPGDRNSLPAISSWITLAYGRGVAEQVVNELAKTTDSHVWENVIVNTMAEANYQNLATKLTSSGIPQIVIDEMLKGAKGEIKRTLRQIFNFGGPGSKGHYGSGVMGMHAEGIMGETLGKSYANQDLSFIQSHVEKIIDDLVEEAGAAGGTTTAPMMADDYSNEFFANAIKEHEDNLAAAAADEAAEKQRILEGKATELDARIENNAELRARSVDERTTKGAWRGITARLIEEESRRGGIKEGEVAAITMFINQIGEVMLKDMSLRISMKNFDELGHYEFANKLVQIYKKGVQNPAGIKRTLIHEIFHGLSTYLPERYLKGLNRELQAARSDWIRQGGLERIVEKGRKAGYIGKSLKGLSDEEIKIAKKFRYVADLLDTYKKESRFMEYDVGLDRTTGHVNPEDIDWTRIPKSNEEYRLTNLDEWFAESMYDRAAKKLAQPMLVSDASLLKEFGHRIVNALFAAINRISGYKASEVAFRNFWTKRFAPEQVSEMALQDRLLAKRTGVVPTTQRNVMNLDPADPLAGANHPIDNVAGESDNVMAAGIVPSDTGSMMLPSYQHMDRINETFVKLMQKRYKDVIDTPKNIAKLENDLLKLNEALQKASTPGQAARIQKQIDKAEASLDIQRQIAALPLDIKALDASWLEKTATKIGTTHDVVNHYYNDLWFKSLALLTGGWATRTGMSEAALNIMRQGPLNYTASRLSASVARQERAIFHVGKKFTRQAAEDIAARIYHVIKENDMLDPAGKVFGTEEEMHAAVANIRRVANEINANFDLTKEEILKAIQTEERNMSDMTMNKAVARSRGVVIGLKRAAVKSLGKDELLDAAIKLMYMNDGHIVSPMLNATHAGVAQDMQVSGNTSEEIDAATYERPLIGKNRGLQEGHHSRVYHSVAGTRHRFAGDLFYRSQRMVNDEVYHQTIQDYAKAYESAKAMLIAKGGMTEEQISAAAADMAGRSIHLQVQKRLAELSPDVRAALIRTRRPLDPKNPLAARNQKAFYDADGNFMLDPETEAAFDHATAVIKSAEGTYRFVQSGAVNEKLLYAIAQDRLPEDLNRFKKLFMTDADGKAIPANRFNSVPGPELDHAKYGFIEKVLTNTVGRATNVIHRKALGPIVNRLTRDPIYIVDFAAERRLLEPMVKDGRLTRDQADVLAQSRASVNTMKYIHNPKNKLKFENMMRLWAPFYFAENQAWRRLGRLALTNPGAAEQYTKAMYAVQDAVFQENEKNSNMSIPIPGTSWLNKYVLGPVFTGALSLTSGRFEPHLGTDQGLEFNPSSLRTVFPWASEGGGMPGIGSLISSFIPKGGPILSIPAGLYLQHAAGVLPFADEFLAKQVVGDAGLAQSMLLSLIAPNAIIANAIKIGVGMSGAGGEANQNLTNSGVMSKVSSSFVAAESMAIVSVLDNMQQKALEEAKQETAQLLKSYKKGDWQKDKNKNSFQYFMDLGGTPAGWATKLMTEKMMAIVDPSDASKYQDFRDMVNSQTTAIMNEKLVIAGISPFSIQVGRAHPELNKEWQDLVTKEGSIINALPKWYKKYPWATAETLYTTQATTGFGQSAQGVSYPTQPEMGKWMLERMDDIRSHPSAMRWVVPSELESPKDGKGGYDQMAHMLQMSLQLRAQKAPEGMIKTYRDSMFNQFVYGTLQPWGQKLIKQGWTVTQVNNFLLHNETNWKNKPRSDWSLLEQFGKTFAPQAFEDYRSGQGATNRSNAMEQLIKVTNDPAMVKKYPTFGLIKKILLPDAEDLKKIKANIPPNSTWGDTNIPYRDGLAQAWQGRMDELEAQHPELSAVITQLFRPLAPVFTND